MITMARNLPDSIKVGPIRLETCPGVPNRAAWIDLAGAWTFLKCLEDWVKVHWLPFELNPEGVGPFGSSFIHKAAAHLALARNGFGCQRFCFLTDRAPNFWANQWHLAGGGVCIPNVVGLGFNDFQHVLAPSQDRKQLFWKVEALTGGKAGPVPSQFDPSFVAQYRLGRNTACIDFEAQSGDAVGQVVRRCVMICDAALNSAYSASAFGFNDQPRYWDPNSERPVVLPGETKGEIFHREQPQIPLRGRDVMNSIIGGLLKERSLVLVGSMPIERYLELAIPVHLQFRPDWQPSRWWVMPLGATSWDPIIDLLRQMQGFDQAIAGGRLIVA